MCHIVLFSGVAVECFACTSLTSDGSSCGDPFSGDPSITPKCSLSPDVDGVCIKQQVMSSK
jgi:hypothetical protein